MERVHFQQEQMLPELKDLAEKGIFTEKEIRQIVKQRTAYETALVRRVAKKADFLRYIQYEMDLETLRKKRVKRIALPKSPATVSDYAFVRRVFHIFERALKRFKSDVGLWTQYIQVAKREGAKALVGRITARAVQMHPNVPSFYILAAAHELDNLAPSAARALLQRGIRSNPDSVDMWKEYVKMELGFIESLRRRWDILGIKTEVDAKGKNKATDNDPSPEEDVEEGAAHKPMDVDEEDTDGSEARQQIMEGAIVRSVIANAAKGKFLALPKIELFVALKTVISDYPSPPALRSALLDTVYGVLEETLPRDPAGMVLRAQRHMKSDPASADFVEGLSAANEEMLKTIGDGKEESLLKSYAGFVENWYSKVEDDHLKSYLIASLTGLLAKNGVSPSLLAAHIRLLTRSTIVPAKLRKLAQKYTRKAPQSGEVWLARLEVEREQDGVEGLWAEARKQVQGSEEDVQRVWMWGLELGRTAEEKKQTLMELLREGMGRLPETLNEALCMHYVNALTAPVRVQEWKDAVRHMDQCAASGRVWQRAFERASGERGDEVVGEIYEQWRKKEPIAAALGYGRYLLTHGQGRAAMEVVSRAHGALSGDGRESAELAAKWQRVLGEAQG